MSYFSISYKSCSRSHFLEKTKQNVFWLEGMFWKACWQISAV